jgi:hypothetical protein
MEQRRNSFVSVSAELEHQTRHSKKMAQVRD